ncbi:PREDICTED: uncharacterized protein LOC107186056 [Dufourea novaeangliae]|uniref:uncharacterized protein LOC107186056 n=1 Tax=Dufourea novaeangliae TaxID=178035 RepID=UPI0007678242|nr:PREDICTED: uncharacterized protein LOC107186056 [Dufourea novaeangliae]
MRTELLFQFTLLLTILLVASSEGFFFEYPKKVISHFLQALKEKKEAKKRPSIEHLHLHYFPVVHAFPDPPTKAPKKHELDELHNEHLAAFGWSDHEYKHVPDPEITFPSSISEPWFEAKPWKHEILESDLSETVDDSENEDIFVQVPYNQKIIIENEHTGKLKKLKHGLLAALYHKITDSKKHLHL